MLAHFGDRGIVGDYEAVEVPHAAEYVGDEPSVGRGRNSVHEIEGCHETSRSCIGSCLVGCEIVVEHALAAHVDRIVVAPCLSRSVEREVLHASHYLIVLFQSVALIALDHDACYGCSEKGIFARAFGHAAPARVAAYVDHRAKCPADATCRCLGGSYAGRTADGSCVP